MLFAAASGGWNLAAIEITSLAAGVFLHEEEEEKWSEVAKKKRTAKL